MAKINFFLTYILFFVSISSNFAQIKIIELPLDQNQYSDSLDWQISSSRRIIPLNSDWIVYIPEYPDERSKTNIPSTFEGTNSLVYERSFNLTPNDVHNHRVYLQFMGLNYSVEISLNGMVIYKHQMGEIPFDLELPADILRFDSVNNLLLKVIHHLDDQKTIPIKQRFLFPKNCGGIIRDINLVILPKLNIAEINTDISLNESLNRAEINFSINIDDLENVSKLLNEANPNLGFQLKIDLMESGKLNSYNFRLDSDFRNIADSSSNFPIVVNNPSLWSPDTPERYNAKIQLLNGANVIDENNLSFTIYSLEKDIDGILLNQNKFTIRGVNYIPFMKDYGNLISRDKTEEDLKFIKDLGFNTVRFAKSIPSPYALEICEKLGLFAFVEIPINSIPDEIVQNEEFIARVSEFTEYFYDYYSSFSSVAAIGVGSSYLPGSAYQLDFIDNLAALIKAKNQKFVYASFFTIPTKLIDNLDFYGIELYSKNLNSYSDTLSVAFDNIGRHSLFIGNAFYPSFNGSTNGHLNPNSFESQAKYYNDLLASINELKITTYFLGTIADYSGDYCSFYSGHSDDNSYSIGIVGEEKNTNRLTYKVINTKFSKNGRITIPIGDKKDDAPILFILASLALAVIMALLINSKRKFREDSTRALLRPYNFFADIRDQRIMSGFHSIVLFLIIAATNSLLFTILFYFFRSNILFEKILLSFGSPGLIALISYFSWNPTESFIYLFFISIGIMILLLLIIKFASMFRKNRVFFSSIFYALVWSLLPITLLLPVELILYKVLTADAINLYLYIAVAVYMLWLLQRLLKAIYVIFDSNPGTVYLYGLFLITAIIGGTLLYFQFTQSTLYHIFNAIKQYQLI